MKRKALKGLLIVLIVLTFCFFFSGTVKTLTTAKVLFVSVKTGKLKTQITLTGYLTFSETQDITWDNLPAGISMRVTEILIAKGQEVKTGDPLFQIEITGLSEAVKAQEAVYQEAEKGLLALENQYANLRLTRADQNWIDAYDALYAARQNSHEAHVALEAAARSANIQLIDGKLPSDISDEALLSLQAAAVLADQAEGKAQTAMDRAAYAGISDDAYQYTMQKRAYEETKSEAHQILVSLRAISDTTHVIAAPHDGYILDIRVEKGMQWDGKSAAMIISGENAECLFRADVSNVTRTIRIGSTATMPGRGGSQVKGSVAALGYDETGHPCVEIAVAREKLASMGTARRLMDEGISISMNFVSDTSAMLLPASAVRGSETNRFVYAAVESQNAFGQSTFVIEKQSVTILEEADDTAAVSDLPGDIRVVYMEDRAIAEGMEVMPYD